MTASPTDKTPKPDAQRDALLDSERQANKDQPRNFKDDALTDKVVKVEPDGTGPSPMGSLDPKKK
ncbi:hypothetical protein [Ideonella sp. BN130291]|uniref:hypothetical protein n=1 Tax=Ideonella sp. BN130291 TaxID=3112940 RepID=UPI002E26C9DE|nr:hypothetical protein [Ideonella sp. BN130291]